MKLISKYKRNLEDLQIFNSQTECWTNCHFCCLLLHRNVLGLLGQFFCPTLRSNKLSQFFLAWLEIWFIWVIRYNGGLPFFTPIFLHEFFLHQFFTPFFSNKYFSKFQNLVSKNWCKKKQTFWCKKNWCKKNQKFWCRKKLV